LYRKKNTLYLFLIARLLEPINHCGSCRQKKKEKPGLKEEEEETQRRKKRTQGLKEEQEEEEENVGTDYLLLNFLQEKIGKI
jgi:hypothetical protein